MNNSCTFTSTCSSRTWLAMLLCSLVAVMVLNTQQVSGQQQLSDPTSDSNSQLVEEKRARFAFAKRRAFAFAKRDFGGRAFAFAKRSAGPLQQQDSIETDPQDMDKRGGYGRFAFAKRAASRFAFAKRWPSTGARSFAFA
uniref:Uncharacterized protein n=1 Tax=Ditylenchus dipsaci TaxID=166011 RepID=A0A915CTU9_9BILA